MKLLLDTNALLLWLDDPNRLQPDARLAIANPRHHVFVSPISIVEIALKESCGKLTVKDGFTENIEEWRFLELRFNLAHADAMRSLPPIHKDPFDRMLVAQSHIEKLTLVTRDKLLADYGIPILAA